MKRQIILCKILVFVLLLQTTGSFAFETDQYNLPAQPLADIGDEVSLYVETNIQTAINKLNRKILAAQSCLNKIETSNKKCESSEKELEKLNKFQSDRAVAEEVYNQLGTGSVPFTKSETWIESHEFKAQPARYKTNLRQSIFLVFPIDLIGQAPTVNLYDTQFGTDKIAHFFQQGYTYYKKYYDALDKTGSHEKALQTAVKWGQKTERTYYGTLMSGVYSNADLYANYAGMKFYFGLTRPIRIGETERPAVLILNAGLWEFSAPNDLRETLLKPFVSNRLNEAYNPSVFTKIFWLRSYVRRIVKRKSCSQWLKKYPDLSRAELEKSFEEIKLWNGEDYGFTDSKNFITIANTCFENREYISASK